jgi:hypothetical protein
VRDVTKAERHEKLTAHRAGTVHHSSAPVRPFAPTATGASCVHRADDATRTETCPTCSGTVALKVFPCAVHGECTITRRVAGVAGCCATCTDRAPVSTVHPNVTAAYHYALSIPPYPHHGRYKGRGIVIVGGGTYWPSAYVCVRMLRHVGCTLPVQVWYVGEGERDDRYAALLAPFDVTVIDATTFCGASDTRSGNRGFPGHPPFEVKSFAALQSPFEEVLVLDADNYPCSDPTALFHEPRYRLRGGVYWPDGPTTNRITRWEQWGVEPFGPACGWEVGQYVLDKRTAWRQLNLARWYDDHGDWCYGGLAHHDHGDKGGHRVGWAMFRTEPAFYSTRTNWVSFAFVQCGPDGRTPMFIHRCRSKIVLNSTRFVSTPQNGTNLRAGLPLESEAFGYLEELGRLLGV